MARTHDMKLIDRLVCGFAIVAFAGGCGTASGREEQNEREAVDQFCGGLERAQAAFEAPCTADDRATAIFSFQQAGLQQVVASCKAWLPESSRQGRIGVDRGMSRICLDAITRGAPPAPQSACGGVVVGRQPAGAACAFPYECASGLTCNRRLAGQCVPMPVSGEACVVGSLDADALFGQLVRPHTCASGLVCRGSFDNGTCAPRLPPDSCDVGSDCETPGTFCHLGTCGGQAPAGVGSTCLTDTDCTNDTFCDTSADKPGICTARLGAGASCSGGLTLGHCRGLCVIPQGSRSGTCTSFCGSG
jgi:hypothetical protein